ncbi:MAG: electron transporter SenC [Chitinophagaceae bacterium]|nr:MAG: electron transporter SenC [Chitinophagaceae bacterium]
MSKKAIVYLIFFGVLFAVFYGVMMYTTDFAKVKLPVLNTVQHFSFLKQDSTMISEQQTQGKVYVVEYFFTSCRGICPKMNKNMKAIYERFKSDSNFIVISHTVNPETDSLPVMRHYADSMGANSKNWWFVTGSKEALYKAARESYMLDDPKNNSKNIDEQFLHTQFFTLVDRIGRVRGVYDGIKKDEVEQLIHDISELIAE